MDEDQNLVILNLIPPFHKDTSLRHRIPSAQKLFKQIQYEAQAKKQLRKKQNQSNVYQKIKKALQRKLGHGRFIRGMSANQEIKIKQMIETCNQRKHIRARNLSDLEYGSQSSRCRNYSAKQNLKTTSRTNSYSRPQTARPKTSKPLTARPQTSKMDSQAEYRKLKSQLCGTNAETQTNQIKNGDRKMKKQSNSKPFFQMGFGKQNRNPSTQFVSKTESTNLIYEQQDPNCISEPFKDTIDGRRRKHKLILKNRFKNIIQNCDNEKEQIICLGKKIGHFQYFCKKMTDKKSHIQKFCKKMQVKTAMLDESFS